MGEKYNKLLKHIFDVYKPSFDNDKIVINDGDFDIIIKQEFNLQTQTVQTQSLNPVQIHPITIPTNRIFAARDSKTRFINVGSIIYIDKPNIKARATITSYNTSGKVASNTLTVSAGSEVYNCETIQSFGRYEAIKKDLIDSGFICDHPTDKNKMIFVKDCPFNTMSRASSIILGSCTSGYHEWK